MAWSETTLRNKIFRITVGANPRAVPLKEQGLFLPRKHTQIVISELHRK
jgi:hypothetical protein